MIEFFSCLKTKDWWAYWDSYWDFNFSFGYLKFCEHHWETWIEGGENLGDQKTCETEWIKEADRVACRPVQKIKEGSQGQNSELKQRRGEEEGSNVEEMQIPMKTTCSTWFLKKTGRYNRNNLGPLILVKKLFVSKVFEGCVRYKTCTKYQPEEQYLKCEPVGDVRLGAESIWRMCNHRPSKNNPRRLEF